MAIRRGEVRQLAASRIGDRIELTATTEGDETTFVDAVRLVWEQDAYAGCDFVLTGGVDANIGETRYVVSSSDADHAVSLGAALPAGTLTGDKADLYNIHETGGAVPEWNTWINAAIADAAQRTHTRLTVPLTGTFSTLTGAMTLPDRLRYASRVIYVDADGVTQYPARGARHAADGWRFDAANRLLIVEGSLASQMDGRAVSVTGWGPPEPLEDDSDETDLSPRWLVARTLASAAEAIIVKGREELRPSLAVWTGEARDAVRELSQGFPANTTRLW